MWLGVYLLVVLFGEGQSLVEDALVTEKVYLDLEVEGAPPARVVIGLFGATSPKTVRNFVALANHEVMVLTFITDNMRVIIFVIICRKAMAIEVQYFIASLLTS